MSGQWPPEWEDTDDVSPADADQPDAEASPRLAEVSAYLASVPAPVLPDSIEARISAALAAEAATRAAGRFPARDAGPADGPTGTGTPGPAAPRSPALDPRPAGTAPARARVRRRLRLPRPGLMVGTLVAVLLFAGLGWVISRGASQSSYSSTAGAPAAGSASSGASSAAGSRAAAAPEFSASSSAGTGSAVRPGAAPLAPVDPAHTPLFAVTESGTAYRLATLAAQARAQEAGAAGATRFTPTSPLIGCVLHFTSGTLPRLVDRAGYQGTDAYVIASSSRVWVVGLGCTAAKPELIVSVPLAG